jgi:hypothetical protein
VQRHFEVESRSEEIFPEEPGGARFFERLAEDPRFADVFAADVDVGVVDGEGEAGDRDPLDKQVRAPGEEHPVLEGPRLALVGVDDQHPGPGEVLRQEPPLDAGGEPRAAAPAEVGLLHFLDDRLPGH